MTTELGRLEAVDPREVWPDEEADFTPWIAAHLEVLRSPLGMELIDPVQKKPVGRYEADIVCEEVKTNATVVIENQLEPTDHDHLGKLITYSAVLKADISIWIAKHFKPEHWAALHWLNKTNGDRDQFHGIEVQVLRNGDSCEKKFVKVDLSKPSPPPRSSQARYADYGRALNTFLKCKFPDGPWEGKRGGNMEYTAGYPGDKSGGPFGLTVMPSKQKQSVEVKVWGPKEHLRRLLPQKKAIKSAIGPDLEWEPAKKKEGKFQYTLPGR